MSISVIINTRNSAQHLGKVLDSVKGFDEVIVCDMGSRDDTLDVARAHGVRVESIPVSPDGRIEPGRNPAIGMATKDWVLVVDDDEIVPPALRRALYQHIHGKAPADGLYLPRRNFVMNRFNSATYPDYRLRFFRRGTAYWPEHRYSQAEVEGKVGKLPANRKEYALIHMSPTMRQMISRISSDTELRGYREGRTVSLAGMLFLPLGKFLRSYIVKGNIAHGVPGLLAAYDSAVREIYKLGCRYEESLSGDFLNDVIIPDPMPQAGSEAGK